MSARSSADTAAPLQQDDFQRSASDEGPDDDSRRRTSRSLLYTSHFLSTWNSRAFEFGAFLFLASIYPDTLLPASVYALARAGSAATFSPLVGNYIDRVERLKVVRLSIIGQRVAVALSCVLLYALVGLKDLDHHALVSIGSLAGISLLACIEKLAAVMNTISVERDWAVIVAGGDGAVLGRMNSQMRRIDLFCKLVAPLAISSLDSVSSSMAILVTGVMTALSVLVEYFAIARVYSANPELQVERPRSKASNVRAFREDIRTSIRSSLASTRVYFTHAAFLPSFALALLYLTVLSFSGQMITYLVAGGFQSSLIGGLRGLAAVFELSATWLAPKLTFHIGEIRAGIWFLNWELACVGIACTALWLDGTTNSTATISATIAAVIVSRIGLWGFDLSAQLIVQEEVEAELRGTFSSQEFAFQNIFEMLSFASTIVFARPENFKIPATVSAAAVAGASVLYAAFVRQRRGHLVHYSRCIQRDGKPEMSGRPRWTRVAQGEEEAAEVELGRMTPR